MLDFPQLLRRILDSLFGNLLSPHLIKIVGNAGHEHKLWDEICRFLLISPLNDNQRLLHVLNFDLILLLVVVQQRLLVVEHDGLYFSELQVLDFMVHGLAIVTHHDFVDQLVFEQCPPLFFVFVLVHLVEGIDELQNGFVADYLFGRVHPQQVPFFKLDEVGLVAAVHNEVVDGGLVLRIEKFA